MGQSRARERLAVEIEAALRRGRPLRHLLLTGPPGVGKTHLAHAVAQALGAPLERLSAPQLGSPAVLAQCLAGLRAGAVLFVDEVHTLPARVPEALYEALDEGVLTLPVSEGSAQRGLRLRLRPFTLIGATTDEDRLPEAFRSRLGLLRLELYSQEELGEIAARAARGQGVTLEPEAGALLAGASRDRPRRALELLDAVLDQAVVSGVAVADRALVERALERLGVDRDGFIPLDRAYLQALEVTGRALSVRTLAANLSTSVSVLEEVIEPFLLLRGLIEIGPGGRSLAKRARQAG